MSSSSTSSTSSAHPNPFAQRPQGRHPSDSFSPGSSSWRPPHHGGKQQTWPADDMDQPFTSEMRDRQARGKDPYLPEAASSSSSSSSGGRGPHPQHHHHHPQHGGGGMRMMVAGAGASRQQPTEPFQKTERRDWAETVLDNPELLMMYAQSSGDTLPATRLRFKKIMCGLDDDESDDASSFQDVSCGRYQHHHQQHLGSSTSSAGRAPGGEARGGRK